MNANQNDKFAVILAHDTFATITQVVEIDAAMLTEADGFASSYATLYPFIVRRAQRGAAAVYLDWNSDHDATYRQAVDDLAGEFQVHDMSLMSDAPMIRYNVSASYDDGDPWDSDVMGHSEDDATFGAKWEMSENIGGDPNDLEAFSVTMNAQIVHYCTPEPVNKQELADTLHALVTECNGGRAPAAGTLKAALDQLAMIGRGVPPLPVVDPANHAAGDVHVFASALDGPDHPAEFIVQWPDGATLYASDEASACAVQRQWRAAIGMDLMTGEPVRTEDGVVAVFDLDPAKIDWVQVGETDPAARMTAQGKIGGVTFHVEAIEVRTEDASHGEDVGVDSLGSELLDDLYGVVGRDGGAFRPVEIAGRRYVIYATPHQG